MRNVTAGRYGVAVPESATFQSPGDSDWVHGVPTMEK